MRVMRKNGKSKKHFAVLGVCIECECATIATKYSAITAVVRTVQPDAHWAWCWTEKCATRIEWRHFTRS